MPWDVPVDPGQEPGDASQFIRRIVEPRHHEGNHFQPEPGLMDRLDGLQNGGKTTAQFTITLLAEPLEIDFEECGGRFQVGNDLRRGVAVGHESAQNPPVRRRTKYLHRPFRRDQRLVVGAHYYRSA